MKKLHALLLLLLTAAGVKAQTFSTTITQGACNNNGTASTTINGPYTLPVTLVYYQYGNQNPGSSLYDTIAVHSNITTLPDVLGNLPVGYYFISGVDANGQSIDSGYFYMTPAFQLLQSSTMAQCPAPGTATVTPTGGGIAPFSYAWTNSGGAAVSSTNSVTGPAGQYSVTVTDANGCVITAAEYIEDSFYINAPITTTVANCTNGSATLGTLSGGTAPYTYLWSNGASTNAITGLTQGSYQVAITDANGCTSNAYTYVQQSITIGANPVTTPATCLQYNGSATVFGSGGASPYTYHYSNGFNGQTLTGVPAGSYDVTVTDANGCTGTGSAYITASTPITVTYSSTASSCTTPTGGAVLSIAGGQPAYAIHWSTYPSGQSGATLSNVISGYYYFNITDANGCIQSGTAYVPPVETLSANLYAADAYCTQANGSAAVSGVGGGTTPYTYAWSTGSTNAAISGVSAGYYSVTVTDAIGCHKSFAANIQTYSPISLGAITTQASCVYNADGAITAYASNGTAPYVYSWNTGATGTNSITGLSTGDYYAHVVDANGCTAQHYSYVGYNANNNSCYCTITGIVFDDANGSCIQDAGETGIEHIGVHCSGHGTSYTDASGHYSFRVPTGTYMLSENIQAFYPLAACQSNSISINTVASSGCVQTADFANVINPIHDMSVNTYGYNSPVPGNVYHQIMVISNEGTMDETAAVSGYTTDGQLGGATFFPTGLFTAAGYQYNTNAISLTPGTQQIVNAYYNTPTNIPLGTAVVFKDTVANAGPISNWLGDYSPWDNVNYYSAVTIGSYDPNFIQASPQGTGTGGDIPSKDSIITYMVHFQNTGTYYAENIVVKNKLDANLDWTTLRPQYSSAPATVTMDDNGVATYTFSNINLEPETWSEDGSQGMFTYTIHLRHGLPAGTTFSNKADIYFDYNAPVTTNSTLNTLLDPTAIGNTVISKANFTVFPNPTTGNFTASITATGNAAAELKVLDLSGRTLKSQSVNLTTGTQTVPVAMSSMASGVYFVTLTQGGVTTTQKLIVGR